MYYNYFKRKKVINYEFNAHKGLVNHSSNNPFKPKFSKLSRRSFSTVSSSLKTDVCTQNNTIALNLLPGGNNQPYGRIMSKALEDWAIRTHHIDNKGNAATVQWNSNVFENDAARFYNDFMRDKFPNRTPNNYWNSSPVRKALRDL